jgi:hypothetical protein
MPDAALSTAGATLAVRSAEVRRSKTLEQRRAQTANATAARRTAAERIAELENRFEERLATLAAEVEQLRAQQSIAA